MPGDAETLVQRWTDRVEKGLVDDFLVPVGSDDKNWVGQFLYDANRWTVQVHPPNPEAFLKAHPKWMALDDKSVFRNFDDKEFQLSEVCRAISEVITTLEVELGPLKLIVGQ